MLRQETVAEHSWNVARILLAIHPSAPSSLLVEALLHDVGEMATGDLPTTAKTDDTVRRRLHSMERDSRLRMAIPWCLPHQRCEHTKFEEWVLKLADWIDGWETSRQECWMGNRFLEASMNRYRDRIEEALSTEPDTLLDVSEVVERVQNYMERREVAWPLQ